MIETNTPRATESHAQSCVVSTTYSVEERMGMKWVVAVLTLKNGYQVAGASKPQEADEFDEPFEQRLAFDRALQQVMTLEGYARYQGT